MSVAMHHGDSREVLKAMPDACFHAVVCDPPYSLVSIQKRFGKPGSAAAKGGVYNRAARGFMGKQWDTGETAFDPAFWAEVYRVLKPGGHLIAFGGTRTYHRLACAIEDGGFEVRDMLAWMFGSGFPKSHNVSKGIDKRGGASNLTREIGAAIKAARTSRGISIKEADAKYCGGSTLWTWFEGRPAGQQLPTDEVMAAIAADWPELAGYASAILEAERPVIATVDGSRLAVAPGQDNDRGARNLDITVSATKAARAWEGWGTALKPAHEPICLARKPLSEGTVAGNVLATGCGAINIEACRVGTGDDRVSGGPSGKVGDATIAMGGSWHEAAKERPTGGRWPANVVHDGSEEVIVAFPQSDGAAGAVTGREPSSDNRYILSGLAGRHDTREPRGDSGSAARFFYSAKADAGDRLQSKHPTVKPVDLMRWLVRLVTPPGGHVLDPFAGSGTTGMACMAEGFDCTLIEREAEYVADIRRRIAHVSGHDTPLFAEATP